MFLNTLNNLSNCILVEPPTKRHVDAILDTTYAQVGLEGKTRYLK